MSGTASSMTSVQRSKEGVPQWNGDPAAFQEYEEQAFLYEQGVAFHKRYLCGPKLVSELQGAAKRLVLGKSPDWVSYSGGVNELMKFLRSCLGRPQIPELTDYLNKYFRFSRRKTNETINDYITRKCELYMRACQSLKRVQKYHGAKGSAMTPVRRTGYYDWQSWSGWHRRSSLDSGGSEAGGETAEEASTTRLPRWQAKRTRPRMAGRGSHGPAARATGTEAGPSGTTHGTTNLGARPRGGQGLERKRPWNSYQTGFKDGTS